MILKTYKGTVAMRETLTLMIWIYSLDEVTYKYEKGREDFIMPNKPYTATTKRKKKNEYRRRNQKAEAEVHNLTLLEI